MPIIPTVGRKSLKLRLVIAAIYGLLAFGGLTMVYPYAITLTQSVSSSYDFERYDAFPRFLVNSFDRYLKYLGNRYYESTVLPHFRAAYHAPSHWGSFRDMAYEGDGAKAYLPVFGQEKTRWPELKAVYDDYTDFMRDYDSENSMLLFRLHNLREFRNFVLDRYGRMYLDSIGKTREEVSKRKWEAGALEFMGRARGTRFLDVLTIQYGVKVPFDLQTWLPATDAAYQDYVDFARSRPPAESMPATRHFLWSRYLLGVLPDPAELDWPGGRCPYAGVYDIPFYLPDDTPEKLHEIKRAFIEEFWPIRLVRISDDEQPAFYAFMRNRYPSLAVYNKLVGIHYARWEDLPFRRRAPIGCSLAEQTAWRDFVLQLPRARWELLCPEDDYQDFLLKKYGSVAAIEKRYGWTIPDIREVKLPIPEVDYVYYLLNKNRFLKQFLTFNYGYALDHMLLHGRAFFNTFILVFCSILAALTVNPLAAYALSRFQPRNTYQILTFFLATMAFPPMVAAIPSFLLLRDLGLLNTYAALILPTVANGYAIFLLKGFFDSLPQELYEAASIDGASEALMFRTISLPLVKPILAVIALQTFVMSYGGFMWALIVCQKQSMWTLAVWMVQFYNLNSGAPYLATAGMVLTSIPTLLVFVFCQKIILRGIVIPTMK